jgi:hypothetical protein
MRVTAYTSGNLAGTNTKTTSHPGTWPVDTLSCSFAQGFDSVVVHYDSHPPTCQDYGVIFMADNMNVNVMNITSVVSQKTSIRVSIMPNPISRFTTISFYLFHSENIKVSIYDNTGRLIHALINGPLNAGEHEINWDINDVNIETGVYFLNLNSADFSNSYKLVVLK